jgi:hypothetical protein
MASTLKEKQCEVATRWELARQNIQRAAEIMLSKCRKDGSPELIELWLY